MTVNEAIAHIDAIKPNAYGQDIKIKWLSELDGLIKSEVIDSYADSGAVGIANYDEDDLGAELLVPAPYDKLYIHYLEMQIDYANNEYSKYNNSAVMYNTAYSAFRLYYNKTHIPKPSGGFII